MGRGGGQASTPRLSRNASSTHSSARALPRALRNLDDPASRGSGLLLPEASGSSLLNAHDDLPQPLRAPSSTLLLHHSPRLRTGRVAGLPNTSLHSACANHPQRSKRMSELLAEARTSEAHNGGAAVMAADVQVFVDERSLGAAPIPRLDDFRDVLKVIDARERSMQNIKT